MKKVVTILIAILIVVGFLSVQGAYAEEKTYGRLSYDHIYEPTPDSLKNDPNFMTKEEIDAKAEKAAEEGVYGDGEPILLAFSQCVMNHPVRIQMVNTFKQEADKYSNVEAIVTEGDGSFDTEISNIESLILQKPDVINVSSLSGTSIYPAYEQINEAGIPLTINNSGVPDVIAAERLEYESFITPDDWRNGRLLAEFLAEELNGEGNVIVIGGVVESSNHQSRLGGFMEVIKNYPDINIVGEQSGDWLRMPAMRAAMNLLQANPDVDGIYAMNDEMAMGVLEALRVTGREDDIEVMVSVDGQEDFLYEIKESDGSTAYATVYWESRMKDTVNVMLAIADGAVVPQHILLKNPLITKENVDKWIEELYTGEQAFQ